MRLCARCDRHGIGTCRAMVSPNLKCVKSGRVNEPLKNLRQRDTPSDQRRRVAVKMSACAQPRTTCCGGASAPCPSRIRNRARADRPNPAVRPTHAPSMYESSKFTESTHLVLEGRRAAGGPDQHRGFLEPHIVECHGACDASGSANKCSGKNACGNGHRGSGTGSPSWARHNVCWPPAQMPSDSRIRLLR